MPHTRRRRRTRYDEAAYLNQLGNDLDADATYIGPLLGELNPYDPHTRRAELIVAMDYIEWCIGETDNPSCARKAASSFPSCTSCSAPVLDLPRAVASNPWQEVKDGDPRLLMVFQDHYSYRPPTNGKRKNNLVIGPGYKLALIVPNAQDPRHGRPQAIFAWRLERYRHDRDYGANCAFFRNESRLPASALILAAEDHAICAGPTSRAFSRTSTRPR